MKGFLRVSVWGYLLLFGWGCFAQTSTNRVDFQVTYDLATARYTAWVVPRYDVPNSNNTGTVEQGGTAQFTIKVPSSFSISNIQDVRGQWDKAPLRLGPGNPSQDWSGSGLDPAINYYVIGKSATESSYGAFTSGVPVALFTFQGNGCFGPISPLEPGHPFIAEADQRYSFNVPNSFYSRSGTPSTPNGGNQTPLEQFRTLEGNPAECAVLQATPDSQTLTAGLGTIVPVLANDTYNGLPASATNVTVSISTPPATGTAIVNANGTIGFTPAPGYSGPVSFTYTICAPTQTTICSSAVVNLTVNAGVVANPDVATTPSGTPVTASVLANDTRNGQPASATNVTVSISTPPATGTAIVNADGSIGFTPAVGFSGPVSLSYTICDISQPGICSTATLSINVGSTVQAAPDSQTLTAGLPITLPVLTNDTYNGQPASATNVTVTVSTPPATGTAIVNADGTIGFTPAPGFSGPVSFTYTICDISQPAVCSSAPISLTVNAVVVANPDVATTPSGTPVTASVLANDTRNGQPASTTNVTVTVSTPPATGTALVNADGTITYTPAAGFSGVSSLSYTICDINQPGSCSTATLSVSVVGTVQANPDSQTLTEGTSVTLQVLNSDTFNGQPVSATSVTVSISTPPATGTAIINADGSITFTPAPGFSGPVSFTYTICDINRPSVCSSARVSLTVNALNRPVADLLITKQVSQPVTTAGSVVSFTITVQNTGPGSALGVSVMDTLTRNSQVQLQGTPMPSKGTFDPVTGVWTVGDLATNEIVTLVLSVRLLSEGVFVNVASVTATGSDEPNSSNNQASACVSVPYLLCTGETLSVSVPASYRDVRWFRNNEPMPIFTGNSITISQIGTYTVSASNGQCPLGGCCPIIVQDGACCPVNVCIPIVIRKTK